MLQTRCLVYRILFYRTTEANHNDYVISRYNQNLNKENIQGDV